MLPKSAYRHHLRRVCPMIIALLSCLSSLNGVAQAATFSPWPMTIPHTGFVSSDYPLTPARVQQLHYLWSVHAAGAISGQPLIINQEIYWGSWDGYLHATTLTGHALWQVYLGSTFSPACHFPRAGVAATPVFTTVSHQATLVVGGGDGAVYAVNARTGHILWRTALGKSPATFLWTTPLVINNAVYMGIASLSDCPLVRGGLAKLNLRTGAIQVIFHTVPAGCIGASIWGSPTYDRRRGIIYAATGNLGPACHSAGLTLGNSVLALRATDLALVQFWTEPAHDRGTDEDFGASPTLFRALLPSPLHRGVRRLTDLVGLASKNGRFYAFARDHLNAGPVWQTRIADSGNGSFSTAAYNGATLYVGGSAITIGNRRCAGSINALNPDTGKFRWRICTSDAVEGAISGAPGMVVAAENTNVDLVRAGNGRWLAQLHETGKGSHFDSSATLVEGRLYIGNMDGTLLAYGI